MIVDISNLMVTNAGAMVIDSLSQRAGCFTYILFFTFRTSDEIYYVGGTAGKGVSDAKGFFVGCAGKCHLSVVVRTCCTS